MAKRRKRGEGSVHLRKDGRWEGRCVIGYDDKGLPITKNVLAKTKTECVEKLKKLRENCAEQHKEKLRTDMTFGEWMDFWYQNYSKPKLRPNTQTGYANAIYKHITPALGKIPLSELGTNDIQQFYAKLKKEGRLIRTEILWRECCVRNAEARAGSRRFTDKQLTAWYPSAHTRHSHPVRP